MTVVSRLARYALASQLDRLQHGGLLIRDGNWEGRFGESGAAHPAVLEVHDPRFYRAVVLGGHIGAAEAYMSGWWTAHDLTALVQLLLRNRDALDSLETGWAWLAQPLRKAWHALNRNTRPGSRRNITAHYDLGDDFFELVLDETLTYSCAIFEHPTASLRDASLAKYERLCRKLDLKSSDHILEIGAGWGGFALYAATTYGCRVTTTTISPSQYAVTRRRVDEAGLGHRITVLQRDYRDLDGQFDKLVSIEMIEAVGHHYLQTFFQKCATLLARDGMMALQAITIQDRHYDRARREVDFIKRYIFPGSCIPSSPVLLRAAEMTSLSPIDNEEIGPHYAETLRRWRANLVTNWDRIRDLGFSDEFRRLWEFYFCYCEGGFREGALGNVQLIFANHTVAGSPPVRQRTARAKVGA